MEGIKKMTNKSPDISDQDIYLFHQGTLFKSYEIMGSHLCKQKGNKGVRFTVWAPNAEQVSVVGDFNEWNETSHKMNKLNSEGLWNLFISGLKKGENYKYFIKSPDGENRLKSDPYAFYSEKRPKTASIVYDLENYQWQDQKWQQQKNNFNPLKEPVLIYEVHLGSWRKKDDGSFYTYRELADELIDYVVDLGYTHIEILPVTEHPYDRSWGYQITGYYSVTSRYGTPEDFKYFVDQCHQKGIGIILDWVPGHFCKDDHGLRKFDGTCLYEYDDPRKAENPEWGTLTFDFGRCEVQSFLISNAFFWMDVYHIDGIRVDAVATMLYLNYGRDQQLITNEYGGRENLEAIAFLKKLNKNIFSKFPDSLMIAEESSEWPLVSAPVHLGGLGFNFKWNMGWMNDMLEYMEKDSIYRKWHHNLITFSFLYAFSENFILPLSHDEVVYGKKSLLNKMPGDYWQKFANLRVLYGYMMTHPGKKLLFMGGEFAQFDEWKDQEDLDWHLLDYELHAKMKNYVKQLNHFYLNEPGLWELDHDQEGFHWIDPHNNQQSIIVFMRKGKKADDYVISICNFTPEYYPNYKIGVPEPGTYREVFNSDLEEYGGSGKVNRGSLFADKSCWHNQPCHLEIEIPPLTTVILKKIINSE